MTALSSYGFQVDSLNGGTARRTLHDRIGDPNSVINVKDWGALGNGVNDDQSAIQDAIDHAYSSGIYSAILYIPAGTYLLLSGVPLRVNPVYPTGPGSRSLTIIGAGRDVTILKGSYSVGLGVPWSTDPNFLVINYVSDPYAAELSGVNAHLVQDLTIWNTSEVPGSGALLFQWGQSIRFSSCRFIGTIGLVAFAFQSTVENCIAQNSIITDSATGAIVPVTADAYTPYIEGPNVETRGFFSGSSTMINNYAIGYDLGFAIAGDAGTGIGGFVCGNKASRCKVGFGLGYGGGGQNGGPYSSEIHSVPVFANWADRCQVGFVARRVSWGVVGGNAVTGTTGPTEPSVITNMSWDNGSHVVTVTTQVNHNIPNGTSVQLSANLIPDWDKAGNATPGIVTATTGGNVTQFTYPGPASGPPAFSSGTWTYPINAGISITASKSTFMGIYVGTDNNLPLTPSLAQIDLSVMGTTWINVSGLSLMALEALSWALNIAFSSFKMVGCSGSGLDLNQRIVDLLPLPWKGIGTAIFDSSLETSLDNGDIYNVTDSQSRNFGEVVSSELITNAATDPGDTPNDRLYFASIPSSYIIGMRVRDVTIGGFPGIPLTTITAIGANYIDIAVPVTQNVPIGARVQFDLPSGGNNYKVRYDGESWVRIG